MAYKRFKRRTKENGIKIGYKMEACGHSAHYKITDPEFQALPVGIQIGIMRHREEIETRENRIKDMLLNRQKAKTPNFNVNGSVTGRYMPRRGGK